MRIVFVNMPFSSLQIPSIALHQLKTVVHERFGDEVTVDIQYLNHDFGELVGPEIYAWISESLAGHTCGFGEWLFRQAAFPEEVDNTEQYFERYRIHFGAEQVDRYFRELEPVRRELPGFLDAMIDRYGMLDADLVGLTSMFFQNNPSFALARRLQDRGSRAIRVMGGANCEGPMGIEMVHHVPALDFVFSGHALVNFPEFVAALRRGDTAALQRMDGVFSRDNTRSIRTLPEQPVVETPGSVEVAQQLLGIATHGPERDLNREVVVDYDRYLDSYDARFGAYRREDIELLFETSRGCWWGEKAHCTFCGLNGATMKFRELGPTLASRNIQMLIDRYSDRVSRFASVDNIIPRSYIDGVLPGLRVPEHVTLFYEIKADLSQEQLRTLAKARVVEVQPGIEAIATETLKRMRKGTHAFNNIRFLSDCIAEGVKPIWNLLVGFPGETAETFSMYLENLPRMTHLYPPSGVFPVRFDRFSPYFTQSEAYGLSLEPLDYHELNYPFPREVIANMAYYFRDRHIDAPYQVDIASNIAQLRALVGRWRGLWERGIPRLRLVEDAFGWIVEDSRSGHRLEHELSPEDVALLKAMEGPMSSSRAAAENPDSFAYLQSLGLLFEERGRVMSLVMEGLRHPLCEDELVLSQARGSAESASLGLSF